MEEVRWLTGTVLQQELPWLRWWIVSVYAMKLNGSRCFQARDFYFFNGFIPQENPTRLHEFPVVFVVSFIWFYFQLLCPATLLHYLFHVMIFPRIIWKNLACKSEVTCNKVHFEEVQVSRNELQCHYNGKTVHFQAPCSARFFPHMAALL